MPSDTREMIVKAFVDLAMWPFNMHVDNMDRSAPRLTIQNLRVIVPLNKRVWRDPVNRDDARRGIVTGPALGISARHVYGFAENSFGSELDVLRELGAILLLAQERAREGRTEEVAGKGMWWSEKPRWAGLPYEVPGEYQAQQRDETEGKLGNLESNRRKKEKGVGGLRRGRRESLPADMTMRQRAIHAYKLNLPPTPMWEPKARYVRLGADKGSDYDEAFMISSLNHHLSVLKLRVHKAYLEYFEHGKLPNYKVPKDWSSPVLQRTRWFDLISPTERVEAFRCLWALGGYLSRQSLS